MHKKLTVFLLLISLFLLSFSQQKLQNSLQADKNIAKQLFDNQNYRKALEEYILLLKNDGNNIHYLHSAAICLLNTYSDKKQAVDWLEKVTINPKCDPNAWYDLGRAYQYQHRFEEAINSFNTFLKVSKKKDNNYIPANRQIEMCENAKKLIQLPVDVTFKLLGNEINSTEPDFFPYISEDESQIIFSSKRAGNIGNLVDYEGFNSPDIFVSEFDNGWKKAKRLSLPINTIYSDILTFMSKDKKNIIIQIESEKKQGELFFSELKGKNYSRPTPFPDEINSVFDETAACITDDNQFLFFASNRQGGYGAKDIYYSRRLASGIWTAAVNLGEKINTEYDENFPYLAPDGETLYFCSVGHNSIGGYDLFKSKWDKTNMIFSEPENLGFPINTPYDERTISFTKSGRFAYTSFYNEQSKERDIYKVIFNNKEHNYTIIKGEIILNDSTLIVDEKLKNNLSNKYTITVYNSKNQIYGKYLPNKNTMKYVIILKPDNYSVKLEENSKLISEFKIQILDREIDSYSEIERNFVINQ